MYTKNFLVSGGNKTCLVWDCRDADKSYCIETFLNDAEQIGFVSNDTIPTLTMMGGELCVNAVLALAGQMQVTTGLLHASGITNCIRYTQTHEGVQIVFDLPFSIENNIVLFEGIGYLCTSDDTECTKEALQTLAMKYTLPAFGIIIYAGNKITPWVYVVETQSLIKETACGSGSIALHLISGISKILQPTGQYISVTHEGRTVTVTALVQSVE